MGPLFLLAAQRALDTLAAGAASELGPLFLHDQTPGSSASSMADGYLRSQTSRYDIGRPMAELPLNMNHPRRHGGGRPRAENTP
jgi:hypothetical protein